MFVVGFEPTLHSSYTILLQLVILIGDGFAVARPRPDSRSHVRAVVAESAITLWTDEAEP